MPNQFFVNGTSTPYCQPDSQATYYNNTAPITIEFGLPSMDAEQSEPAPLSGEHTANIVDKSLSAQQPSVGEGRSNRHGTGRGQCSRRQLNQGRDSGGLRRGTGSTPAFYDTFPKLDLVWQAGVVQGTAI